MLDNWGGAGGRTAETAVLRTAARCALACWPDAAVDAPASAAATFLPRAAAAVPALLAPAVAVLVPAPAALAVCAGADAAALPALLGRETGLPGLLKKFVIRLCSEGGSGGPFLRGAICCCAKACLLRCSTAQRTAAYEY